MMACENGASGGVKIKISLRSVPTMLLLMLTALAVLRVAETAATKSKLCKGNSVYYTYV